MIIDLLQHASRYYSLHPLMEQAFRYLATTDLAAIAPGRYTIDGDNLFAIVQEYDTMDEANEKMEAHRTYTDIQYMISGEELVGHALLNGQSVAKEYSTEEDFMLFGDAPSFFTRLEAGMFMIFTPTDLHMPCIKHGTPRKVKKVVIKVRSTVTSA